MKNDIDSTCEVIHGSFLPKVTFCTIVLNGEPFIRYLLNSLYPFAHEIIVVEGACHNARENDRGDGHSQDGTLERLRAFKHSEDPENKLSVVTAEDEGCPNGFWPGEKDQMMESALCRSTGNWVWMIDSDEFYMPETLNYVVCNLLNRSDVDTISFPSIMFWGSLQVVCDGWRLRQLGNSKFHRIFRWKKGYRHMTHRPPTVVDEHGVDLRDKGWIHATQMASNGHYLYHYAYLFPFQVFSKCRYYSRMDWGYERMQTWFKEHYMRLKNPYRVDSNYTYPSWLEPYNGIHPPQITAMWNSIMRGDHVPSILARSENDLKLLLRSRRYRSGRILLKYTPAWLIKILQKSIQCIQKSAPSKLRNLIQRLAAPSGM